MLELLAQGLPRQELAGKLDMRTTEATALIWKLQEKFGANDMVELVKLARAKGTLPSD